MILSCFLFLFGVDQQRVIKQKPCNVTSRGDKLPCMEMCEDVSSEILVDNIGTSKEKRQSRTCFIAFASLRRDFASGCLLAGAVVEDRVLVRQSTCGLYKIHENMSRMHHERHLMFNWSSRQGGKLT